ncbi:hypothetical protein Moror_2971 [Moniliophthora roreri MCA 2997]|uniref:Uncharacterized protein n=1 Tax=Moniliophthora roreri (strain MCA 2997) TaxID=1381753 RepID=V2W1R0_MONRO|nr:hypothetical protein Moror_2971 [Moniliophthora roreri MCA 2997]
MSLYQVEFALPIDNTDINYACTDSESEESSNSNEDIDGSQADELGDEPTKECKADRSDNSFHYESTPPLSKPSPKSKVLSTKPQESGTICHPIKKPTPEAGSSHGTKHQCVDAPASKSSKKAKTSSAGNKPSTQGQIKAKAPVKNVQTSSHKKTMAITLSTDTSLDNTDLPQAPPKDKSKGKAVDAPIKTPTEAPEEDNNAASEPKSKTIHDID